MSETSNIERRTYYLTFDLRQNTIAGNAQADDLAGWKNKTNRNQGDRAVIKDSSQSSIRNLYDFSV